MVDPVLTIVFHFSFGSFCIVAYCAMIDFVSLSSDILSSLSLSTTSAYGKSVAESSPGSPCGYAYWCEVLAPVVDAYISDCVARDVRSDDIVPGMPSSSIVMVSVVDESMRYGHRLRGSSLEYEAVAVAWVAVTANGGQ